MKTALLILCLSLASCSQFRRDVSTVRISGSYTHGEDTAGAGVDFVLRDPSKDGLAK